MAEICHMDTKTYRKCFHIYILINKYQSFEQFLGGKVNEIWSGTMSHSDSLAIL